MEADIKGHQKKVIHGLIAPRKKGHGSEGIPVKDGRTLPFTVARDWSAPAGHYVEQWFIVDSGTREVLYESLANQVHLMGLQSPTRITDEVTSGFKLEPGKYLIVYALDNVSGGEFEVEAVKVSSEAA